MRGRWLALAVACAPAAIATACSTFSSSNDTGPDAGADVVSPLPPPPPTAPPPVSADASTDSPADAGVDAPNLLVNGDFEIGCGGWSIEPAGGTLATDTTARSGLRSCRVCRGTIDGGFSILTTVGFAVPAATYVFEFWARATPDDAGGPPPADILGRILVLDENMTAIASSAQTPGPPLDGNWQQTSALVGFDGDGGTRIEVLLGLADGSGNCWLVDDARLYPK